MPSNLHGTFDDRPAENVDLFPTIARAAGLNPPPGLAGRDLLAPATRQASFCEFHDAGSPAYMWRKPDWKLILFMDRPLAEARNHLDQTRGELYNLREDPHEWKNLYANPEFASIREQLKTELLMHLACSLEPYPYGKASAMIGV